MTTDAALAYPIRHNTILDVVDENDIVTGQANRAEIHDTGLIHREVHILYATPRGEIVFQRRAADKDTWPGYLDSTVGGHVELGQTYEEAALREAEEETGLILQPADLTLLGKELSRTDDPVSGRKNNCFRTVYGYTLRQPVETLTVETDAGAGFVAVPLARLEAGDVDGLKMIPMLLDHHHLDYYRRLVQMTETAGQTDTITGR